jgi:hypothetical protein
MLLENIALFYFNDKNLPIVGNMMTFIKNRTDCAICPYGCDGCYYDESEI